MQAASLSADADLAEIAPQRREQAVPILPIMGAHPRDMRCVARTLHHIGECRLLEPAACAAEQALCRAHRIHEPVGHHHVAQSHAGSEGAREGPEVNGAVGRGRRDRFQGRALVAELAVGIVFHDVAAAPARPRGDGIAPRRREDMAGRKLMRRRQIEKRRRALRQAVGNEPGLIDRDADDLGARRLEGRHRAVCAGVLHDRRRAAIEEEMGRKTDALLHAGGDKNPTRISDHAAGGGQMSRDGGAQRRQAGRVDRLGKAGRAAARQLLQDEPAPRLQREKRWMRPARSEIDRQPAAARGRWPARRRRRGRQRHRPSAPPPAAQRDGRDPGEFRPRLGGDEYPRGRSRLDKPLDHQRFVGANDRVARDLQLLGEASAGGKPGAAGQSRFRNGAAELADDLIRQAVDARAVEKQGQLHGKAIPLPVGKSLAGSGFVAMRRRGWTHRPGAGWRHPVRP